MAYNMEMMIKIFLLSGLGGLVRWVLGTSTLLWFPKLGVAPGTLIVNIVGSFAIGFFSSSPLISDSWRVPLTAGLLGGFTTFSAFSLEGMNLIHGERFGLALVYLAGSVVVGVLMCNLGFMLAQKI